MKIIQTPALIIMLNPDLTYRQIYMDGRPLDTSPNPSWMGYSVGRWDGDTLVVDSVGFNDRTWLDAAGHPHGEKLHVIERYTRSDSNTLQVQATIEDTDFYTKPWTVKFTQRLMPDAELIEFICSENDTSPPHMVGK